MTTVELADLGIDEGGHLLIKRALADCERVLVRGQAPTVAVDLPAWCRANGHTVEQTERGFAITRGVHDRWHGATRAGGADAAHVVEHPAVSWGLAARGALVEAGGPALDVPLADKRTVWADEAPRLYAQAAAAQWDPSGAIPWDTAIEHPGDVEDAVVQVMTYLIENETAALLVPVRFLGQLHPHFREVMQLLAIQAADEARHIEVFARRASLRRHELGLSTVGGQASLATLFAEPEFAIASFLLSVLGEGSFLALLGFWQASDAKLYARGDAPGAGTGTTRRVRAVHDPLCRRIRSKQTASRDRAPAYGTGADGWAQQRSVRRPALAAGGWGRALRRGHAAVVGLTEMDAGRRQRRATGFMARPATLSALHTRNFM
jgi:hypothetical protein